MDDEDQLINFIDQLEHYKDYQKLDDFLKEHEEKFLFWSIKPLPNELLEQLKEIWSNLQSILLVNKQRTELQTIPIQLGNRVELEQLRNQIRVFLEQFSSQLSDEQQHDLANRQLLLRQMLIDTNRIERLRVNLISEFQTATNADNARTDIQSIIDKYSTEMTTQIRQWFNEHQTTTTNVIEPFRESLHQLENDIRQYHLNPTKVKDLLQSFDSLPSPPEHLSTIDRQRYLRIKTQLEHIRKKHSTQKSPMDQSIETIDRLIKRIREYEEQLQNNIKQSIVDYETLLLDCQRIHNEIEENLQIQVEHAIHSGKKFYSITDSTAIIDSADESSHSPSSSPILKKRSDLTIRKVRRHVLQLGQHWKNLNANVRHRQQQLERLRTVVEELRGKCDRLHGQLLEIELACAHTPQIRALTIEQIPTEIEQAKNLLSTLMSHQSSIDEIQQSAQTIENDYQLQATVRTKELQQRWEHSINSINQRLQSLRDAVRNADADIYSISVEYPWQRTISSTKRPYYINHTDQTTSWDHPKMTELIRSFSNLNDIRFAAYRTAMKLRTLQKCLCLDLTSLNDIRMIFDERAINDPMNKIIDISQIQEYLQGIFSKTAEKYPQLIHVIPTVDLTLNWLLNIYDVNRTGTIRLLAIRIALSLLCRGNIEEKYRHLFSLVAHDTGDRHVVDRSRLSLLFQHALVIPKYLGEVAAFGGSNVEPSVQSCFESMAQTVEVIDTEDFLQWMKLEPQSLVWLPVMHRLAASEAAKHEARCNICKVYPILGFRYRSLRHFNCDICQTCFFAGKQTKLFKMDHPLQEYYSETTSSEDIRDFFRIFKNKLCKKQTKTPKLGYLPLPHVFDHTNSATPPPPPPPPVTFISTPNTPLKSVPTKKPTTDEHGLIAQHCKDLHSCSSDEQREELEGIIADLEEENHLLQMEYERLCQEHDQQSTLIDRQWTISSTHDDEILRQAKELRQYQSKLEQRMKILEEHNQHIEKQLKRSKEILSDKDKSNRTESAFQERVTIDNLFQLADGINRAVGDLVSVISGSD